MGISLSRLLVLAMTIACMCAGGGSYAGQEHPPAIGEDASRWHSNDHSRVRLIRGGQTEDGQDLVGLVIEMDEGWHTYWRSPGRLGLPPTFNWEGSENVRGVEVEWPLPHHIVDGTYETYGYESRLVLPLIVARDNSEEPAHLNLAIGYAVCESVCIPALGFVSMILPQGDQAAIARPEYRWAIEDARSRVPSRDLETAGIAISPARLVRSQDAQRVLRISITSEDPLEDPHVIIEGPKGLRFGVPKLRLDATGRQLEVVIPIDRDSGEAAPIGAGMIITLTGGAVAVEHPLMMVIAEEMPRSPLQTP